MVGHRPIVSIVIRTKNEERFIGQTLSAIFGQEIEPPFEVIVIDSGSTDSTLNIVRKFDAFPFLPMYFILKYPYIYKGIKQGKRLYGPSKCQGR